MDNDSGNNVVYTISVNGRLDTCWMDWFDGMQIATEIRKDGSEMTILSGPVVDQVALRGLLTKIWNLNMELISVSRIEIGTEYKGE